MQKVANKIGNGNGILRRLSMFFKILFMIYFFDGIIHQLLNIIIIE